MSVRDEKEMKNLFSDPKFSRKAWKSIGLAILQNPAVRMPEQYDKDGAPTLQSEIENYTYSTLAKDIKQLGEPNREPTTIEMIMGCQAIRARFDVAAATFIRDTVGAKPVDESKLDAMVANPYEQFTDEELELIAQRRRDKAASTNDTPDTL